MLNPGTPWLKVQWNMPIQRFHPVMQMTMLMLDCHDQGHHFHHRRFMRRAMPKIRTDGNTNVGFAREDNAFQFLQIALALRQRRRSVPKKGSTLTGQNSVHGERGISVEVRVHEYSSGGGESSRYHHTVHG